MSDSPPSPHRATTALEPGRLVARIDEVTETDWHGLLDSFADASLYHTWAYGAVSWGEQQLSHLVLLDNGEPLGLAQLRIVRIPVLNRGVAYLRWGPVCHRRGAEWDPRAYDATLRAVVAEYVQRRRLLLRIVPHHFQQDPHAAAIRSTWDAFGLRTESRPISYCTLRVDLTPPLETLRKRLDQKWRNQLNGALRNGLEVVEGTGLDLFDEFLALYRELMARKQFETTVDPLEFRRIQERLPENQKMWILISRKEGRPMTGLVGSVVGDTGIYLLGATSDEGMKTKGSYLLQWRLMEHLRERGCRAYDLGGVNPETNPGVYHFKQGMGGQQADAPASVALCIDRLSAWSVGLGEWMRHLRRRFNSRRATPGAAVHSEPRAQAPTPESKPIRP